MTEGRRVRRGWRRFGLAGLVLAGVAWLAYILGWWSGGIDRVPLEELQRLAATLPEPTADEFPVLVVRENGWGELVPAEGVQVWTRSRPLARMFDVALVLASLDRSWKRDWVSGSPDETTGLDGIVWLSRRASQESLRVKLGSARGGAHWYLERGLPTPDNPPVVVLREPPRLVIETVDSSGEPVPFVSVRTVFRFPERPGSLDWVAFLRTGADGRVVVPDLSEDVNYRSTDEFQFMVGSSLRADGERWQPVDLPDWGETAVVRVRVVDVGLVELRPVLPDRCELSYAWLSVSSDRHYSEWPTLGSESVRMAVPLHEELRVRWGGESAGEVMRIPALESRGQELSVDVDFTRLIWVRGRMDLFPLSAGGRAVATEHVWAEPRKGEICRVAPDGCFSFPILREGWEEWWDRYPTWRFRPPLGAAVPPFRVTLSTDHEGLFGVDLPIEAKRILPPVIDVGTVVPVELKPLVSGVIRVNSELPYDRPRIVLEGQGYDGNPEAWADGGIPNIASGADGFAFYGNDIGVPLRLVVKGCKEAGVQPIDPIPVHPGQTDVVMELKSARR